MMGVTGVCMHYLVVIGLTIITQNKRTERQTVGQTAQIIRDSVQCWLHRGKAAV